MKSKMSAALMLFVSIACSGKVDPMDFATEGGPGESSGGSTNDGEGVIRTPGTTQVPLDYYQSGYGGGLSVVGPDGNEFTGDDLTYDCHSRAGKNEWAYTPLMSQNNATCQAGTLCTPPCETDADCPAYDGDAGVCKEDFGVKTCILPCASNEDCSEGMICGQPDGFTYSTCLFSDTPWALGCSGFCATDGDQDVFCDGDDICCEGYTCADARCVEDVRSCLDSGMGCAEGTLPCCDGLSCQAGLCE